MNQPHRSKHLFRLFDFITGRADGSAPQSSVPGVRDRHDRVDRPDNRVDRPASQPGEVAGSTASLSRTTVFGTESPSASVFDVADPIPSSSRSPSPSAEQDAKPLEPGPSHSVWDDARQAASTAQTGVPPIRGQAPPLGIPEDEPAVDPAYDADDRNWVRYRPRWGSLPRLLLFVLLVVASVVWVRSRIYRWVEDQVTPEGLPGEQVEYTVVSGASVNDIAGGLYSVGVISNATVFRYWLRCDGELSISKFLSCDTKTPVEAGDYMFRANMDFNDVLDVLNEGPTPSDPIVLARITIPEGLRWTEMVELLQRENPTFDRAELESAFVSLVDEAVYLPDDARVRTLEGLLFPATYDIGRGGLTDEHKFLQRLLFEFTRRFRNLLEDIELPAEARELELLPYHIVVIASLIEEEALIAEDRPKIARVIYNRLLVGEPLGIDASVCYAANKPCVDLTQEDVERESPWNTRMVRGLPPTPISAPGEASLRAALQPAEGDWLFYVLTDDNGVPGAHHFSETLDEHNEHVKICRALGYCR